MIIGWKVICFEFVFEGEAAEPKDPSCISPTSTTLGVHVPCQVEPSIVNGLTAVTCLMRYRCRPCNGCDIIQGSFQEGEDIHSDSLQGGKIWGQIMTLLCSGVICSVTLLCSCDVYSVTYVLVPRWTSSRWPTATCSSPTWTGWRSSRRSRRPRKPPSDHPWKP